MKKEIYMPLLKYSIISILVILIFLIGYIGYNNMKIDNNMENIKPALTEKEILDIALPVLEKKYGNLDEFKPWKAQYTDDGNWNVYGTLPEDTVGGTPQAIVSEKDKKVIDVYELK